MPASVAPPSPLFASTSPTVVALPVFSLTEKGPEAVKTGELVSSARCSRFSTLQSAAVSHCEAERSGLEWREVPEGRPRRRTWRWRRAESFKRRATFSIQRDRNMMYLLRGERHLLIELVERRLRRFEQRT